MKKPSSFILIGTIILTAIFLRFSNFLYIEYKGDERIAFIMAENLGRLQTFPLRGLTSSIGAANPPLFIYLISLPAFFIKDNPVALTGLVTILNIATVVLTYFLAKNFLAKFEALVAAGFLAVSTWAIIYSRKLWAQDCLPFFTTCFLLCLMQALKVKNKKVSFLFAGFLITLLFQIHYSGLAVLPCLLVYYFLYRKRFRLKPLLLGTLMGLIFLIPFFIYQFQTNLKDLDKILNLIINLKNTDRKFQLVYFFYPFLLTGGLKTFLFLGFDYLSFLNSLPKFIHILTYMVFTANIILIILGSIFSFKLRKKNIFYPIVLVWFLIPTLILSLTKIGDRPFYYLATFPSQFILLAIGLNQIRKIKALKLLTYLGTSSAFLLTLIFNIYLKNFIVQKKVIRGDYGWVYKEKVAFIKNLKKELGQPIKDVNSSYCIKGNNSWEVRYLLAKSLDYPQNKIQLEIALNENSSFAKAHYDLALVFLKEGNFEGLEKEKTELKRLDFSLYEKIEKMLSK